MGFELRAVGTSDYSEIITTRPGEALMVLVYIDFMSKLYVIKEYMPYKVWPMPGLHHWLINHNATKS